MGSSLKEIAQQLRDTEKKVQLIYAFNGTGKTRLSREFKELVVSSSGEEEDDEVLTRSKILYYNAFTEDLFSWDNDLEYDAEPVLKIQPNSFTDWILEEQGQDRNITEVFQKYCGTKLTPNFTNDNSAVSFSFDLGNDENIKNIKISKGEESNFIWSIFYNLITQVIEILNVPEEDDRETDKFNELEYIFIDDPVSSLDENHLIEMAVDLSRLVKSNMSPVKFIITTHNPLFYNILHNEFNSKNKSTGYKPNHCSRYRLDKEDDGTYSLTVQPNDAPFSYHLYLIEEIEKAIAHQEIKKYHFNILRNILEKTSVFLGYKTWGDLLDPIEGEKDAYLRIINLYSHSKYSTEEVPQLEEKDKRVLKYLIDKIVELYRFRTIAEQGARNA
ncbi:AAA family ATPase [Nitratifractor sp.]